MKRLKLTRILQIYFIFNTKMGETAQRQRLLVYFFYFYFLRIEIHNHITDTHTYTRARASKHYDDSKTFFGWNIPLKVSSTVNNSNTFLVIQCVRARVCDVRLTDIEINVCHWVAMTRHDGTWDGRCGQTYEIHNVIFCLLSFESKWVAVDS